VAISKRRADCAPPLIAHVRAHMAASRYAPQDILDAASYACVKILPLSQREAYARDIRVKYKADLVVVILQELSHGMTSIFIGLLTNYLYDKARSKARARHKMALRRSVRQQRRELRKLRRWLDAQHARRPTKRIEKRYNTYAEILTRVDKADPSIAKAIEDAVRQLEKRGAAVLREQVSKQFR
jgi:hypothetical protein